MYQVHRHKTEPRRFFIYEQYKDDAALEAHRTAPHFLQFAKKDLPKVSRPRGRPFVRAARLGYSVPSIRY
jgi:autoinducer 2-degrading protein